jgi:hypothetical protein
MSWVLAIAWRSRRSLGAFVFRVERRGWTTIRRGARAGPRRLCAAGEPRRARRARAARAQPARRLGLVDERARCSRRRPLDQRQADHRRRLRPPRPVRRRRGDLRGALADNPRDARPGWRSATRWSSTPAAR